MTDLERVSQQFDQLTRRVLHDFERQLQIAKASNDREETIKQQIKIEVLKAARAMYSGSHRVVMKSPAWPEESP